MSAVVIIFVAFVTGILVLVGARASPRARERALVGFGVLLAIGGPVAAVSIVASEPARSSGVGATVAAPAPTATATEVVSAAPTEPTAPLQKEAPEASPTASELSEKRRERPIAAAVKRPAAKGVYDIPLPPGLKK